MSSTPETESGVVPSSSDGVTSADQQPPAPQPGEAVGISAQGPKRSRRQRRQRSLGERLLRTTWVVGAMALLGYPMLLLFRQSVLTRDGQLTLANYQLLFTEADLLQVTLNSAWIGGGAVVGSLLVGLPMAFLISRTDLPFRRLFRTVTVLTFATPSFIAALGWILLLGPRNGMINNWLVSTFGLSSPPFNIFSPWGIIFVLSMFLYPLVFLPTSSALDNMDPALEQAAANLGASRWRVLRTVTLPLALPAVLGGSMLVFVTAFVIFGPVAILGSPVGFETIPTALLALMRFPPRIETAAVLAVPVLLVIVVILVTQKLLLGGRKFTVVGGKPGARQIRPLGRWKPLALLFCSGVLFVSLVLPFGVLLLTSFRRALGLPLGPDNLVFTDNYARVLAQPQITAAFRNSFVLSIAAVAFGIVFALIAAWMVQRTSARTNTLIAPTMLSPLAFPGAIIAIALVIAYARPPFSLGGGLMILFIGYAGKVLPLSYAYINAGMQQVGADVEEASRSLGASWARTARRITLPLLRNTVLAVALLNFVLVFRELETSVFLFTGGNPTTATVLFNLANESLFQLMGAMSVLVLMINIVVVLIAIRWLDRT